MKQRFALPLILWSAVTITTLVCQVQGGIITQQQSMTLPDSLASATASNETSTNGTRSGRVMYTASYSNVRIASKEHKALDKYYPLPAILSKKSIAPVANIVPVLHLTSTSTSTTSTTTTTTSTTTTTPAPPPSTTESVPEEPSIPEIMVVLEEADPMNNDDEVVTETVKNGSPGSTEDDNDEDDENEEETVTEPSLE